MELSMVHGMCTEVRGHSSSFLLLPLHEITKLKSLGLCSNTSWLNFIMFETYETEALTRWIS